MNDIPAKVGKLTLNLSRPLPADSVIEVGSAVTISVGNVHQTFAVEAISDDREQVELKSILTPSDESG